MGSAQVVAPAPPGFPPFLLPLFFCLHLLLQFILLLCPLPGLRVSRCFSLAFSSLCVACLFCSCFGLLSGGSGILRLHSGPPTSLLHPLSPVSDSPVLSAASALPLFCSAPQGSTAGPSGFASSSTVSTVGPGGSAPQPGPSSAFLCCLGLLRLLPLLLSPCLVTVLMSLCSWFVGPDAPGAAAPDPEALVPPSLSASARAGVRHM